MAKSSPSDYTQGIMELGAVVCTPTSPSCSTCPVQVSVVRVVHPQRFCKGYALTQKRTQKSAEEMVTNTACSVCCDYPVLLVHTADV